MTPGARNDEDGQMVISGAARTQGRAGVSVIGARAFSCAVALLLAGCVQPGAVPGAAPGQPAAAAPQPGQVALPGVGTLQMPVMIRWPLIGGGAAGGSSATPQVTDPFAGQGVRGPSVPGALVAGQQGTQAAAGVHTVVASETAWSIARRYGISVQELARANNLPETMSVRAGQRLTIPAAAGGTAVAAVTPPGMGSATPRPPSASQPLPNEQTRPASAQTPQAAAPDLGSTRTAASGSGKFAMPAGGSIIRAYKKGTNEGIDIAAAPGSPVKAAGGGTVAAVTRDTDGVPIVVVRHDDGLMTVYAGVDKLSVGKGDRVSRGQNIGAARSSGILHFEVRNGFDSVDPEKYL